MWFADWLLVFLDAFLLQPLLTVICCVFIVVASYARVLVVIKLIYKSLQTRDQILKIWGKINQMDAFYI